MQPSRCRRCIQSRASLPAWSGRDSASHRETYSRAGTSPAAPAVKRVGCPPDITVLVNQPVERGYDVAFVALAIRHVRRAGRACAAVHRALVADRLRRALGRRQGTRVEVDLARDRNASGAPRAVRALHLSGPVEGRAVDGGRNMTCRDGLGLRHAVLVAIRGRTAA
eukprot:4869483-Prymnesium_polylepis.2